MSYEPIAIIAEAILFPGASSPDAFYQNLLQKRISIAPLSDHFWRVDPEYITTELGNLSKNCGSLNLGGYAEKNKCCFTTDLFGKQIKMDPLFQWLLILAEQNFSQSMGGIAAIQAQKLAIIIGNLSYPTHSFSQLAENLWLKNSELPYTFDDLSPVNRFMSGYPAQFIANYFHLQAPIAYCLDAACASSLYAIKYACDALQTHQVDIALAGGINRADDLFIHIGFCALNAMSKSGCCRPLQQTADGLIPAQGAALLLLKRLDDALANHDTILGVIRGIGLSNNGTGRGLLVPSIEGQVQAMKNAYRISGIESADIDWIECHATGTGTGDTAEIESLQRIFPQDQMKYIGANKGNIGHMTTASAMAGISKVLHSFKYGLIPPTLFAGEHDLQLLGGSPFQLSSEPLPWPTKKRPNLAAINAFGFGGNNAHLILERWQQEKISIPLQTSHEKQPLKRSPIAVVGLGVLTPDCNSVKGWAERYFYDNKQDKPGRKIVNIDLSQIKLHVPPKDLEQSLGQQLAVLFTSTQALSNIDKKHLNNDISVYMGMQCQTEICRYNLRWRLVELFTQLHPDTKLWLNEAKESICTQLTAAGVIGTMPNIVTNRINFQLNAQSSSFSVSAEELSGLYALSLAINSLRNGECHLAIAGAVDMNNELADAQLLKQVLNEDQASDLALTMSLMRYEDAKAQHIPIYALIDTDISEVNSQLSHGERLKNQFGYSHCCMGFLSVFAAVTNYYYSCIPADYSEKPKPWMSNRQGSRITATSFSGHSLSLVVKPAEESKVLPQDALSSIKLYCFANQDIEGLRQALIEHKTGSPGAHRIAFVADSHSDYLRKQQLALRVLDDCSLKIPGIFYADKAMQGKVTFMFTGANTSYPGMGRDLLLKYPSIIKEIATRYDHTEKIIDLLYDTQDLDLSLNQELETSSYLCQAHALFSEKILGLKPDSVFGYCSGETNALIAMQAWRDMSALLHEVRQSNMYTQHLSGKFKILEQAWQKHNLSPTQWSSWRLLHDVAQVSQAVAKEPLAHLAIINTDHDCIISGHEQACQRVAKQLGLDKAKELAFRLVIHCPEFSAYKQIWRQIHSRDTFPIGDIQFYSSATGSPYTLTQVNAAESLTAQASQCVDLRKLVNNVWNDGARIFIEHGPRNLLSEWIKKILGANNTLILSYDYKEKNALQQAYECVAQLWAQQVPIDLKHIFRG